MISRPSVTLSIIPASQLAGVQDQKVLAIGQITSDGSATSGELVQDIGNDSEENALFGQTSHLAGIIREFKKLNKKTRIDAIPLDDSGTGVAATSTVAFSGTATEDGTFTITVCSEKNYTFDVAVTSGDAADDVGDAVDAAVLAMDYADDAPFTSNNSSGTVTFTAENTGTLGNGYDIKCTGTVAGLTYTVGAWASGANDSSLTDVFDVISNLRYQTIIWPSSYTIATVQTELDARFNVTNDVKDGIAIQVYNGTLASAESYISTLNSPSLVVIPTKPVSTSTHKGSAIIEMPDVIAAQVAAVRALRLTEDAPLAQFLTSVARSDQYGGIAIASLPYFNTSLPNLPVPDPSNFYSVDDVDEMADNGLSIVGPNRAYNGTIMGEFVTTYLTNDAGGADTSYKYLNTIDTASVIREYFFENLKNRYAQTRLTSGDLIAGRDMANDASIRAFCNLLYDELADEALVASGKVAKTDFNDNLIIESSISTGTVEIYMAPLLVSQLRAIIGTVQINFGS